MTRTPNPQKTVRTEEQPQHPTYSSSLSLSSTVKTLIGCRSVSALGRGLTSTTLLSGVQRPLSPAWLPALAVYVRARISYLTNPFATYDPGSESDSYVGGSLGARER